MQGRGGAADSGVEGLMKDDKTLAKLLKQKIGALPKAAQKQLDALIKRFSAIAELPGPSTDANVAVDALIVLVAFIFGTFFLGIAISIILEGIYEWSWGATLPLYDFFRFLRLFPKTPPPYADELDYFYITFHSHSCLYRYRLPDTLAPPESQAKAEKINLFAVPYLSGFSQNSLLLS